MPLPEHEQRRLQEIEQALCRDDPKFGRLMRAGDPRVRYARTLLQALVGVVIGVGLLVAGAVGRSVYLEAAGVVMVLLSVVWAVVSWRRHAARVRPARTKASRARSAEPGRPARTGQTRRARLMERMEERWRRRQEGDRRM